MSVSTSEGPYPLYPAHDLTAAHQQAIANKPFDKGGHGNSPLVSGVPSSSAITAASLMPSATPMSRGR